jgi:hypothetical protein
MGILICEAHGRAHFVEACSHITEDIDAGLFPDGRRFTLLTSLFLCEACFSSLGYEQLIGLADLPLEDQYLVADGRVEAAEAAYEKIPGRQVFCEKCVTELEVRQCKKP